LLLFLGKGKKGKRLPYVFLKYTYAFLKLLKTGKELSDKETANSTYLQCKLTLNLDDYEKKSRIPIQ
jgi:hypothetical protein